VDLDRALTETYERHEYLLKLCISHDTVEYDNVLEQFWSQSCCCCRKPASRKTDIYPDYMHAIELQQPLQDASIFLGSWVAFVC